jgi:hypothetical protein
MVSETEEKMVEEMSDAERWREYLHQNWDCDRRDRCKHYQSYWEWHKGAWTPDVEWVRDNPRTCKRFEEVTEK